MIDPRLLMSQPKPVDPQKQRIAQMIMSGAPLKAPMPKNPAPMWGEPLNLTPQQQQIFDALKPADQMLFEDEYQKGVDPEELFRMFDPTQQENPGGMFYQEDGQNRFNDAAAYRTADMSGIEPAGVGEQAVLQKQARAFQSLMTGLDDYERLFNEVGQSGFDRVLPGSKNDALSTAHRNLQMQMKELYNLGVLNGPDLDLMNQILLDPTDVSSNLLGAVGIGNMAERIPANIKRVREMMRQLAEPGLQQLGLEPEQLMPKRKPVSEMSDEEIKQMLLGGS